MSFEKQQLELANWRRRALTAARFVPRNRANLETIRGADYYTVYANQGGDGEGNRIAWLAIASPDYHVTFMIWPDDLDKILKVRDARWEDRTTIRIGMVHLSPSFWSMEESGLSILAGHDDEAWSLALTLPAPMLGRIITALEPLRRYLEDTRPR